MFGFRITKYNPQYRDARGAYLKDEWTCYDEIGKKFENKKFTFAQYEKTERLYSKAILLIMERLNLNALRITYFKKNTEIKFYLKKTFLRLIMKFIIQ